MSFGVNVYRYTSDNINVNKNKTLIHELTGELRDTSSIIDPVILVNVSASNLASCNYMDIPVFSRMYFINDIISIRNELTEIHGHCDVLSTYWDYYKSNSAIVHRQENLNNLYLDDGTFKLYQNPNIVYKDFPNGFTSENFVLIMAGPYVDP